jgi:hypothetical protein
MLVVNESAYVKSQLAALLGKENQSITQLRSVSGYLIIEVSVPAIKRLRPFTLILLLPYDVKLFGML